MAFGSFRLYARRLDSDSDQVDRSRIRRALLVGESVFALLTAVVLFATGAVAGTVHVFVPLGPIAGVLAVILVVIGLAVVLTAGYLGLFPLARDLRGADMTTSRAAIVMFRWILTLFLILLVLVSLLLPVVRSESRLATIIGYTLIGPIIYIVSPWIVRLSRSARPLTDNERDQFDSLSGTDLDVHRIHVLSGQDTHSAKAFVRGYPRQLFVTNHLFEAYDERVSVVLAAAGSRLRHRYLDYKMGGLTVLFLFTGVLFTADRSVLVMAVGYLLLAVAFLVYGWYANQLVYRADRDVADRIGREAVITTYEQFADARGESQNRSWLSHLSMNPQFSRRIEQLRDNRDPMD